MGKRKRFPPSVFKKEDKKIVHHWPREGQEGRQHWRNMAEVIEASSGADMASAAVASAAGVAEPRFFSPSFNESEVDWSLTTVKK